MGQDALILLRVYNAVETLYGNFLGTSFFSLPGFVRFRL